ADLAPHTTAHSIVSVRYDFKGVRLEWSDGRVSVFHVLWLRDNCACRECRHPQALERTYIFIDHAAPVVIDAKVDDSGDLEVRFQQGTSSHVSSFLRGWLRAHDPAELRARSRDFTPRRWSDDIACRLIRIDYTRYREEREGVRAWIAAVKTQGIVLLEGVPQVSGKLL